MPHFAAGTARYSGTTGYREPVDLPELLVADTAEWRTWLRGHHSKSQGVWLVLAKKGTTHPTTLSYDEALDEAICFGSIDGQLGRRDNATFRRRFTPRNARSPWSHRNVAIAERLSASGRMHRSGEDEVRQAKADGRWNAAYAGQASVEVPEDLADALIANPRAQANVSDAHKCESVLHPLSDRECKEAGDPSKAYRAACGDAGPRRDNPPARSTITSLVGRRQRIGASVRCWDGSCLEGSPHRRGRTAVIACRAVACGLDDCRTAIRTSVFPFSTDSVPACSGRVRRRGVRYQ